MRRIGTGKRAHRRERAKQFVLQYYLSDAMLSVGICVNLGKEKKKVY